MELARRADVRPVTFTADWLAGQLSGHTARAYRSDIRQFLDWLGSDDLPAVRREDIYRFRAHLVEQFAPASVNRKLSSLRQLFVEAVRHGVISHNPTEGIRGHKSDGSGSSTKAPSFQQFGTLLESLSGDTLPDMRDRAMIHLMAAMGLRCEEVARVRLSDITEDQGYTVLTIHGKGAKRRRNPIPSKVLASVRKWIAAAQFRDDCPVFQGITHNGGYHLTGRAIGTRGIYHVVTQRFDAVGIEGCSPHSLRHFNATELLRRGCDIYTVQRWLGHADPRTTERYNRAREDLDSSAANYVEF